VRTARAVCDDAFDLTAGGFKVRLTRSIPRPRDHYIRL
jgi:hypothetical protein